MVFRADTVNNRKIAKNGVAYKENMYEKIV